MKNACRSVITVTHLPENRWMIRGLSVFDRIAALSATSRNRIQAETGRHVDLIYPSTGAFPSKEPAGPLTKLREDSGNIRIIYPGDLAFAEVESVLARGMYAILEKHEHVTFILASRIKTSRDERVERRIVRSLARFAGRVEVTRTAEDMRALLDGTDIVVFPVTSVYAKMDLPLVLIEAMGCGKPIIVSQCGSLPELVAYDNGLVFPSGDISGFIECLDCLITSESSCKAMGERGKKAAGEMFSVDRMMDSYMLVYRSLLAGECPS